jgi:hypothetical protein
MAQPATLFLTRELTRTIPFTSQKTFNVATLPASNTLGVAFDVGIRTTDRNQLIGGAGGAAPSVAFVTNQFAPILTQQAIGTVVDVLAFSTGIGSITVFFAVDSTCVYRALPTVAVPASTLTNISDLRVTGRYCLVVFTNTSGGNSLTEFGAYTRSQ